MFEQGGRPQRCCYFYSLYQAHTHFTDLFSLFFNGLVLHQISGECFTRPWRVCVRHQTSAALLVLQLLHGHPDARGHPSGGQCSSGTSLSFTSTSALRLRWRLPLLRSLVHLSTVESFSRTTTCASPILCRAVETRTSVRTSYWIIRPLLPH